MDASDSSRLQLPSGFFNMSYLDKTSWLRINIFWIWLVEYALHTDHRMKRCLSMFFTFTFLKAMKEGPDCNGFQCPNRGLLEMWWILSHQKKISISMTSHQPRQPKPLRYVGFWDPFSRAAKLGAVVPGKKGWLCSIGWSAKLRDGTLLGWKQIGRTTRPFLHQLGCSSNSVSEGCL